MFKPKRKAGHNKQRMHGKKQRNKRTAMFCKLLVFKKKHKQVQKTLLGAVYPKRIPPQPLRTMFEPAFATIGAQTKQSANCSNDKFFGNFAPFAEKVNSI